jgi:glutamate-1-semialdehyde 2,1-aminomutase
MWLKPLRYRFLGRNGTVSAMAARHNSQQIFSKAKRILPGGVNSPVRSFGAVEGEPFVVARGEGPYLYDVDGNRYVDYVLSWGPLVLGHAHAAVVEAVRAQAALGTSYGACCAAEVELAECIGRHMPALEMLRFVNSGTEAAMSVLRLSRAFTRRSKILKFAGCYHGHVDSLLIQAGSGVLTLGLPGSAGVPEEFTRDTLLAPFNDLDALRLVFQKFPEEIAAVIVEPVAGNTGLILPQPGFLAGLREATARHGALLIFDEVMTGFRVHPSGAQGLYDVRPDLTMLGKVIGGGLPVGAFGGRREIMEMLAPLGPVYQAGTLSGNPLAMAAGLATLRVWLEEGGFELARAAAAKLVQVLRGHAAAASIPLACEASGTMFGFFFQEGPVMNCSAAARSDLKRFARFFHMMLEEGVYFAPSQYEAGFVSMLHGGEALDFTAAALGRVFKKLR